MAVPSKWGSVVGNYGQIGIYTSLSSTATVTTVYVEVWFWSKYSVEDSNNTLTTTYNGRTTSGSVRISTDVASGHGWSTDNQVRLEYWSFTVNRATSDVTETISASLKNVDRVGGTMYASTTVTIPKLASYTVKYNANGGSGAPSSQTKWHGKTLTLSSTKPTRTGYSFQGWGTSASDTSVDYEAGADYTANAAATLYAIWKANTYKVSYDANGGSGEPAAQTKTYGVTLKLSTTIPTRNNYTFKGWAKSSTATDVQYAAGANYTTNSAVTLYAVWQLTYYKPKISNLSVERCTSDGTSDINGSYARVKFKCSAYRSCTIECVLTSANGTGIGFNIPSQIDGTVTPEQNVDEVLDSGLDPDNTYEVVIEVYDGTTRVTKSITLEGSAFPIEVKAGGKGIAFNKSAELDDTADFNFELLLRKLITISNNTKIFGTKPDGTTFDVLNASNSSDSGSGNTVLGYDNYDRADEFLANGFGANTNMYGYDINFGVANIANKGTYRPYRRRGDSLTFSIRTAGYVTNSGKDVSFLVPFAVPIIGGPTVTVSSLNGFVLRQNEKYTHGSGSDIYVHPDSYSAQVAQWCGIYVTAHFTNVTNVVNNNAIGIYWNGSITFS